MKQTTNEYRQQLIERINEPKYPEGFLIHSPEHENCGIEVNLKYPTIYYNKPKNLMIIIMDAHTKICDHTMTTIMPIKKIIKPKAECKYDEDERETLNMFRKSSAAVSICVDQSSKEIQNALKDERDLYFFGENHRGTQFHEDTIPKVERIARILHSEPQLNSKQIARRLLDLENKTSLTKEEKESIRNTASYVRITKKRLKGCTIFIGNEKSMYGKSFQDFRGDKVKF